jgi:hypothetical protein
VLRRDINKQECVSYRIPALAPFIYARVSFSLVKALGLSTMNMDWKTVFRQTFLSTSFSEISSIIAAGDIVYCITCVRRQARHLKCHFDSLTSTVDRALCIATSSIVLFTLWPCIFPFHLKKQRHRRLWLVCSCSWLLYHHVNVWRVNLSGFFWRVICPVVWKVNLSGCLKSKFVRYYIYRFNLYRAVNMLCLSYKIKQYSTVVVRKLSLFSFLRTTLNILMLSVGRT